MHGTDATEPKKKVLESLPLLFRSIILALAAGMTAGIFESRGCVFWIVDVDAVSAIAGFFSLGKLAVAAIYHRGYLRKETND